MIKLIKSLSVNSEKIWSIAIHPVLPQIAITCGKTVKIFEITENHDVIKLFELKDNHRKSVKTVSFQNNYTNKESNTQTLTKSSVLACGSFDSTVSIWKSNDNLISENQIFSNSNIEWNVVAILEGHENEVKSVDWNHTGNFFASCSRDKCVWIWETDTVTLDNFECAAILTDHHNDVKYVCWHPNMDILASASFDESIKIYSQNLEDGIWECVESLEGHNGTVWCLDFENNKHDKSPLGFIRIVSSGNDGTVRIWSKKILDDNSENTYSNISIISNWEQEVILPQIHEDSVNFVSWSKKSNRIVSAGSDGKIVIYNCDEDNNWIIENYIEYAHGYHEITSVKWTSFYNNNEELLSTGDDGCICIWEI